MKGMAPDGLCVKLLLPHYLQRRNLMIYLSVRAALLCLVLAHEFFFHRIDQQAHVLIEPVKLAGCLKLGLNNGRWIITGNAAHAQSVDDQRPHTSSYNSDRCWYLHLRRVSWGKNEDTWMRTWTWIWEPQWVRSRLDMTCTATRDRI